ncbi:hypothetical protein Emtol_0007 (plasmid) [Emticicia oligotrophica DSM 17448]|uniref:Uncharacterized protein n=1 Tax=Emticicia oligotrophica (strain DSM 17448 / CIP 109782 / MTCC 6937 / GPTSA100-15) TaxID=929562 RepID=A0ABN4AWJ4_EMTOG|nr:hypothetical protein Emtol_0007 [Emticicia oligotrophica DSM 17448]
MGLTLFGILSKINKTYLIYSFVYGVATMLK